MGIKVLIDVLKLVLFKYSIYYLYWTSRWIFVFFQKIIWLLNGTEAALGENSKNPSLCVHVQDIIFRHKLDPLSEPPGRANFITIHNSFNDVEYVLNPNVTLYFATIEEAIFVETDPNVNVYDSDCGSFLQWAQFTNAKKLIVMPVEYFYSISEKVGLPKGKVVFLGNTMRCGSTLLCQIFENTGHCLGICEPGAITILNNYAGKIPQTQLDRLIKNVINLLCKPVGRRIDCYMIKLQAFSIAMSPHLARVFPDAAYLFMYREGETVVPSIMRMCTQLPMARMTCLLGTFYPDLTELMFKALSMGTEGRGFSCSTEYAFCTYVWASIIAIYRNCRKHGVDMKAVKYEHLISNPTKFTKNVLEYLQLPKEWVIDGVKALDIDSQRNSVLSTFHIKSAKYEKLNDEILFECDTICKKFDMPPFLIPLDVEGLISSS